MGNIETRMGGVGDAFPQTVWSTILSQSADPREREKRLNDLLTQYWRPIYKYIRASWGKKVEDAKDLTQEFFTHILTTDFLSKYEKEKGRFRYFLKGALKLFLASKHRESKALKRGGGVAIFSLNYEDVENEDFLAETQQFSPEEIFDRQWAREIMSRCLADLKARLTAEKKGVYFDVYEEYALKPSKGGKVTYDQLSEKYSVSATDVDNYMRHVRSRLHDLVLDRMSEFVTNRDELLQEMNELFAN